PLPDLGGLPRLRRPGGARPPGDRRSCRPAPPARRPAVNRQFATAWRLHRFLSERRIPYAIIGGLAVQRWGQPRFTRDVDVTILLPTGGEEPVLRELAAAFPPRVEEPVAF